MACIDLLFLQKVKEIKQKSYNGTPCKSVSLFCMEYFPFWYIYTYY